MTIKAEVVEDGGLTPRQCEILVLICQGEPDKAIARKLAISIKTVQAHCESIYIRLGVHRASVNVRCAAISTAVVRGIVRLSSTSLCLWLMLHAVQLDDVARVSRVSVGRSLVRSRGMDG